MTVDEGEVAAGAEGLLALGIDQHETNAVVGLPGQQRFRHHVDDKLVDGIQRLRPRERDPPHPALDAHMKIVSCFHQALNPQRSGARR